MDKTCSGNILCNYRTLKSLGYGCTYSGYCDYQAPRDSRTKTNTFPFPCTCGQTVPCKQHPLNTTIFSKQQLEFQEKFEPDRNG